MVLSEFYSNPEDFDVTPDTFSEFLADKPWLVPTVGDCVSVPVRSSLCGLSDLYIVEGVDLDTQTTTLLHIGTVKGGVAKFFQPVAEDLQLPFFNKVFVDDLPYTNIFNDVELSNYRWKHRLFKSGLRVIPEYFSRDMEVTSSYKLPGPSDMVSPDCQGGWKLNKDFEKFVKRVYKDSVSDKTQFIALVYKSGWVETAGGEEVSDNSETFYKLFHARCNVSDFEDFVGSRIFDYSKSLSAKKLYYPAALKVLDML